MNDSEHTQDVSKVIGTLRKCVGTGTVPQGFGELVQKIEEKVEEIDLKVFPGSAGTNLKEVFEALKKVDENSSLELADNLEPNGVQGFLDHVVAKVEGVNPQEKLSKFTNLCGALTQLFKSDKIKSGSLNTSDALKVTERTLQGSLTNAKNASTIHALTVEISDLRTKSKKFNAATVVSAVRDATHAVLGDLQHKAYTSYYNGADNNKVDNEACAKIFLGCLPMIFSALSYLYWRCDKGGWGTVSLGGGASNTYTLREFMGSMAFADGILNAGKNGTAIVGSAFSKFTEFSKASPLSNGSYTAFTKGLKEKVRSQKSYVNNPLSTLFICASSYFRFQQIKISKPTAKSPSTIREMLCFLAALPYTSVYDELENHIESVLLKAELPVAVSGSAIKNEMLSSSDLLGILVASSLSSPWVLGTIQGPGDSNNPLLHEIYSSSEFSYLSSPSVLLSKLADYTYALQFQLHFLYQQCSNTYTKACGWNQCTFGQGINTNDSNGKVVSSHICKVGCTTDRHRSGTHDQVPCEHKGCGTKGKPSPLQAFLTDKLKGFSRGHPSDHSGHLAFCSGGLCHVPMGFKAENLRSAPGGNTQGSHISVTLKPFCGGFNTSLRQLSEKLGCLTKRTPRTLGDLFGFTWHLNEQLFPKNKSSEDTLIEFLQSLGVSGSNWGTISTLNPSTFWSKVEKRIASLNSPSKTQSGIEKSLTASSNLPFLYQLFMVTPADSLPAVLFKVKNIPHQTSKPPEYSGNHNDLYSLYNPNCTTPPNQSCGPYLYPLTHSDGAAYAPRNASTYLSWVLYLSDDLQSWFQDMLDEFKNIDCKVSGCHGDKCKSHAPGTHGTNTNVCSCDSVVHCGGTLPLLYRHGFRYNNPLVLKDGWYNDGSSWQKQDSYIRKCSHFASQLNNLLRRNSPLDNLITTIDSFLYAIRWEFFSKLSGFWTIYVCIILYTFFFLLDTLRVRSHLHFPSSNSIAPISLLGTGKAPALKKFTKLTYFIP
ncbi:variant erythrocyte surface antigen-1 family protein [Babesia caballi]|uniref:Variant erythrocyte surface antigen-1 family protein n=1 Tax=Babesia caballi TaxID=5871 RepID=A0AAV4LRW3_BABCB|nr:variant erythrocyte surface antigen-1 family protein [Babesia caballi]